MELPTTPPELILRPGDQKNLLFEVGAFEAKALQWFSRRYWTEAHNAADVLHMLGRVALANPRVIAAALETDFRYARSEAIPFMDHVEGKIRAHAEYAELPALLVTPGHD